MPLSLTSGYGGAGGGYGRTPAQLLKPSVYYHFAVESETNDKSRVKNRLLKELNYIRSLYEKEIGQGLSNSGVLVFSFSILPDGHVQRFTYDKKKSTLSTPKLREKLESRLSSIRFDLHVHESIEVYGRFKLALDEKGRLEAYDPYKTK